MKEPLSSHDISSAIIAEEFEVATHVMLIDSIEY